MLRTLTRARQAKLNLRWYSTEGNRPLRWRSKFGDHFTEKKSAPLDVSNLLPYQRRMQTASPMQLYARNVKTEVQHRFGDDPKVLQEFAEQITLLSDIESYRSDLHKAYELFVSKTDTQFLEEDQKEMRRLLSITHIDEVKARSCRIEEGFTDYLLIRMCFNIESPSAYCELELESTYSQTGRFSIAGKDELRAIYQHDVELLYSHDRSGVGEFEKRHLWQDQAINRFRRDIGTTMNTEMFMSFVVNCLFLGQLGEALLPPYYAHSQ